MGPGKENESYVKLPLQQRSDFKTKVPRDRRHVCRKSSERENNGEGGTDSFLNMLFLTFPTGTAMENLNIPLPKLTEEQQGKGSAQMSKLLLIHITQWFL